MSEEIHRKMGIPEEKLRKLKVIANHNAHSIHEELDTIITEHIRRFEAANGKITLYNLDNLKKPQSK